MRRLAAVVFFGVAMSAACSAGGDQEGRARSADARAWELGDAVGERYGPFPNVLGATYGAGQEFPEGWVALIGPVARPLDAFREVVGDAEERGFTARMREGGACWRQWSREEVPFGESGEGDGEGFGGATPFDTGPLPAGASTTGVDCEATVSLDGEHATVSMRAFVEDPGPLVPARAAIVVRSGKHRAHTVAYEKPGSLDVQLAASTDALTPREVEMAGVASPSEGLAGIFHVEGDWGCEAALYRDDAAPTAAATRAIARSQHADLFQGSPSPVTVAGREAAVAVAFITAGDGVVYVTAAETPAGSDVAVCRTFL